MTEVTESKHLLTEGKATNIQNLEEDQETKNEIIVNSHSMPYLQQIMDNLGLTRFHYFIIFAGCLFYFNEGSVLFELNFIYGELTKVFQLTSITRAVLTSSVFFGKLLGSISSGFISTHYGRKNALKLFSLTLAIFSLSMPIIENLKWLIFCRLLVGYSLGCMMCMLLPTLLEFSPTNIREFVLSGVIICAKLGIIFYVIFYSLIVSGNNEFPGIWKYSLILSSINTVLGFIITNISMKDSPRFLMCNNQIEEGIKVLKQITRQAELDENLLKEEANDFIKNSPKTAFFDVFSEKFLRSTILGTFIILLAAMNSMGNIYSLPLVYNNVQESSLSIAVISQQILAMIGLTFGACLAHANTFGRKYTIAVAFLATGIISSLTLVYGEGYKISSPIMHLFIIISFNITKIYFTEVYPTKLRVSALAYFLSVGDFGYFLAPPLCDLLHRYTAYGPLILIICSSVFGCIFTFFLSFETAHKSIDYY